MGSSSTFEVQFEGARYTKDKENIAKYFSERLKLFARLNMQEALSSCPSADLPDFPTSLAEVSRACDGMDTIDGLIGHGKARINDKLYDDYDEFLKKASEKKQTQAALAANAAAYAGLDAAGKEDVQQQYFGEYLTKHFNVSHLKAFLWSHGKKHLDTGSRKQPLVEEIVTTFSRRTFNNFV